METLSLVTKKMFSASLEDVFDAWTDPKELAKWYGPEGFMIDIHSFDLKEGGAYRLTMNAPDGAKHILRGTFTKVQRPTSLAFTWQWENGGENDTPGSETLVEIKLAEKEGKVEMTFTHSGFLDDEVKSLHNQGWSSSFHMLEKLFL